MVLASTGGHDLITTLLPSEVRMATTQTHATPDLPLRGSNAVEMLVNDHTVIKSMLEDLTTATSARQCKSVFERLKAALTVHNATEENLVYPALAIDAGKKSDSEHLYHETAAADMLVFELDGLLRDGDMERFTPKAKKLQAAILEHIDDEEASAFPKLEQHADTTHAAALTASVKKFRGDMHVGSAS